MAANHKLLKRFGERGRNRTYNLLIKSQLLCQLSYARGVRFWKKIYSLLWSGCKSIVSGACEFQIQE